MAEEAEKDKSTENPQSGADNAEGGAEKTFTQAELDAIIEDRLKRERRKAADAADAARKQAEADAAAKNGEWQKLAEQREQELKQARAEAREATIRAAAARLGIADGDYAVFLVGKAGEDADAEVVLKEWKATNPAATAASGSASATNPDTSAAKTFTRSQLRDPVFFQANKAAILQAAREGRIQDE